MNDTENRSELNLLLVEDNPVEAIMMRGTLGGRRATGSSFTYGLEAAGADVVLLDLSLPDASELHALRKVREQFPDTPVVVLTGLKDEELALRAIEAGAQDYLVKGEFNDQLLLRAVRYAVERHQLARALAIKDDLTGLYNRRGLYTLAEQQVRVSERGGQGFLVLYADLDGLKGINDTYGHAEGSRAIVGAARALRETLRSSDIVARVGGDEFIALVLDPGPEGADSIDQRLRDRLKAVGAGRPYALELSLGAAPYTPGQSTLEETLARADQLMYEEKRRRKAAARLRAA
jgi:two-component system, cell cycle response regulator